MDLSIIILNWNVRDLLRRCLESIFQNTSGISFEVLVVDNASADGSAEMVRNEFPQVKLMLNEGNFGFAKGNNVGLKQGRGDILLMLNPDTEVVGNCLALLCNFIRSHTDAGLVGAEFINEDGTHQPSVRRFPTVWDQSLIMLKLHNIFPRWKVFRRYFMTDAAAMQLQTVDQISGTFFGMPRRTFDEVGLLDERFFIWFEDVDYCRRVWQSEKKVYYVPSLKIRNRGGASFAQVMALAKQRMMNRSMAAYFKKWHTVPSWLVIQILRPISLGLAWCTGVFIYRGRPIEGVGSRQLKR